MKNALLPFVGSLLTMPAFGGSLRWAPTIVAEAAGVEVSNLGHRRAR
jgi:hypothetical protein